MWAWRRASDRRKRPSVEAKLQILKPIGRPRLQARKSGSMPRPAGSMPQLVSTPSRKKSSHASQSPSTRTALSRR